MNETHGTPARVKLSANSTRSPFLVSPASVGSVCCERMRSNRMTVREGPRARYIGYYSQEEEKNCCLLSRHLLARDTLDLN